MKKVIILGKIQVTIKDFTPTFFNHFNLSLNIKQRGNKSHKKANKHTHASAADVLHIRIQKPDVPGER